MKKAMLFVVSMLFAVSVNAASINIVNSTELPDVFTGSITGNDSDYVEINSGTLDAGLFVHSFEISNNSDADKSYRLWLDGLSTYISGFSATLDGIDIISGTLGSAYSFGTNVVLAVGDVVTLIVSGTVAEGSTVADYNVTLATPIPAALFLFAPALLGFFGLRRRATLAA